MDWFDYPDPVIVAYMERVLQLSAAARQVLDVSWRVQFIETATSAPWELPFVMYGAVGTWVTARGSVNLSMMSRDRAAVTAYRAFWNEIRAAGWHAMGRMKLAQGLIAIRRRAENPEKAARDLATFVPMIVPDALGWDTRATA